MEIEAPITQNLLANRVLAAWNISKPGTRINAQLEKLLSESRLTHTSKNGDIVFWDNKVYPGNYEGFRVLTVTGQKRDAEFMTILLVYLFLRCLF